MTAEPSVLADLLERCEPFERAWRDFPLNENGHRRVYCMLGLETGANALLAVRDFRRLAESAATLRALLTLSPPPETRQSGEPDE